MAFSSKMISRITKTTASSTHTANAIRAHNNGGFSNRGTSVNSRPLTGANSPARGYGYSHIGQKRNKYKNDVTQRDYERVRQLRNDDYHVGYGRSSDVDMTNRQEANAHPGDEAGYTRTVFEEQSSQSMTEHQHMESTGYGRTGEALTESRQRANAHAKQGGLSNRMAGSSSRFEASRISGGRFGGAGGNGGAASRFGSTPPPRMSGAANATARPVPKPNFRRPS